MFLSFTEYFYFDMSISTCGIIAYIIIAILLAKIACNYINAKHDIIKAKIATQATKNNKK